MKADFADFVRPESRRPPAPRRCAAPDDIIDCNARTHFRVCHTDETASDMRACYINLDSATDRRASVERNMAEHLPARWRVERFAAIDKSTASARPGSLRDADKACNLSHRGVLERSLAHTEHVLVLEDDVLFGPSSAANIDSAVATLPDGSWDVLYTDICVPQLQQMVELLQFRRQLIAAGQATFLDLAQMQFAGATAYVVHRDAKAKILALLDRHSSFDQPYDLFLRDRYAAGDLTGRVMFPFSTSLSKHADASSIQNAGGLADFVWNAYRRLVWVDRDCALVRDQLERMPGDALDEEAQIAAQILALQLSPQFRVH